MPSWMLAGVIGSGLVMALVLVVTIGRKFSLLLSTCGLLLFSSMALPVTWDNEEVRQTFWLGLQQNREYFYGFFGLLMLGLLMLQYHRVRGKRLSLPSVTLLLMGLLIAAMHFVHNSVRDGILSVGLAIVVLPSLLMMPAALIDDEDDFIPLTRGLLMVNGVWTLMCMVQFLVNRQELTMGNTNRFVGLLANPQHASAFLACLTATALYIALNDRNKLWRLAAIGLLSANAVMILWTGSRTGFGMAVVASAGVLFTRLGTSVLLLPVLGGFFALALKFFGAGVSEASTVIDRLSSGENTRSQAWREMLNNALANPLIGAGTAGAGFSENAWLYGFAAYGIGMLLLSLVLTLVGGLLVLKAVQARWGLPKEQQTAIDLCTGQVLAYFGGAVFEGFFAARISANLVLILIFSGALARLLQIAEQRRDLSASDPLEHEYDAYADYGDAPSGAAGHDDQTGEGRGWDDSRPALM